MQNKSGNNTDTIRWKYNALNKKENKTVFAAVYYSWVQ